MFLADRQPWQSPSSPRPRDAHGMVEQEALFGDGGMYLMILRQAALLHRPGQGYSADV